MNYIKESDWKHLRTLKDVALDRFCNRILSEVERTSSDQGKTSHERYLAMYVLIHDRDKELGRMFNDPRRSNAVVKIFSMRRAGLLTDAEWDGFSDELKNLFMEFENF